jgi:dienelactone hydrolase
VLAVGGGQDQVWPSSIYVDNIERRMHDHGRSDVTALVYPAAGHGVGFPVPNIRIATKGGAHEGYYAFGGSPEADARARTALWPRLLGFLNRL